MDVLEEKEAVRREITNEEKQYSSIIAALTRMSSRWEEGVLHITNAIKSNNGGNEGFEKIAAQIAISDKTRKRESRRASWIQGATVLAIIAFLVVFSFIQNKTLNEKLTFVSNGKTITSTVDTAPIVAKLDELKDATEKSAPIVASLVNVHSDRKADEIIAAIKGQQVPVKATAPVKKKAKKAKKPRGNGRWVWVPSGNKKQ